MLLHINFGTWNILPYINFSKALIQSFILLSFVECLLGSGLGAEITKTNQNKQEMIGPLMIIWVAKGWGKRPQEKMRQQLKLQS